MQEKGWASQRRTAPHEIIVVTLRIGRPDSSDPVQVVAACGKLLSDLLDSLESEHAVLGSVLLIVLLAEVRKMMIEDRVKFVPAPGHVLPLGNWNGRVPE